MVQILTGQIFCSYKKKDPSIYTWSRPYKLGECTGYSLIRRYVYSQNWFYGRLMVHYYLVVAILIRFLWAFVQQVPWGTTKSESSHCTMYMVHVVKGVWPVTPLLLVMRKLLFMTRFDASYDISFPYLSFLNHFWGILSILTVPLSL